MTEGSAIDEQTWVVKNAAASAGGNGYGITMTKYDAQQVGATLEGAEFVLYSVDMDQAEGEGNVRFLSCLPSAWHLPCRVWSRLVGRRFG